jgi:hypothetical protein
MDRIHVLLDTLMEKRKTPLSLPDIELPTFQSRRILLIGFH